MSRDREGVPFLNESAKKYVAGEEWGPAADAFYKPWPNKRRVLDWRRADDKFLQLGYDFENDKETINELHGEDFLSDIIPKIIERVRLSGSKRKIKILDMGCGLGFFNDQIRAKFGDEVEVYGTSIAKSNLQKRKRKIVDDVKNGIIEMNEDEKSRFLQETDGSLHPNDGKWNSVVELSDFPEFDLIVDSEGEIIYAGGTGVKFFPKADSTQVKLICAIKKLNAGGQLFVSRIHERHRHLTPERIRKIETQYGVIIEDNKKALFPRALKITKI